MVSDYQMAEVDGITFADGVHARAARAQRRARDRVLDGRDGSRGRGAPFLVRLCRKPVDYDELHLLVHELAAAR